MKTQNFFIRVSALIIAVVLLLSLSTCRTYLNRLEDRHQMRYFPEEYANIYLGMPLNDVQVVRPAMNPTGLTDSLLTEYFELIGRDKIESTKYYFNKEKNTSSLQKLIIEFETLEETTKVARWLYGKPKAETKEWLFDSKENFMIKVSQSGKKIIIGKENNS